LSFSIEIVVLPALNYCVPFWLIRRILQFLELLRLALRIRRLPLFAIEPGQSEVRLGSKARVLLDGKQFRPRLFSGCRVTGKRCGLAQRVESFWHFRLQTIGTLQFYSGFAGLTLL
jgi:hypothetical protein